MITRRFMVAGRVQGVAFRAATRQRAGELNIRGHAGNLDDGRVEVVATGAADALAALESFLWRGPPHARVLQVEVFELPLQESSGFTIR